MVIRTRNEENEKPMTSVRDEIEEELYVRKIKEIKYGKKRIGNRYKGNND